ncbi:TIGR02679 family protein [Thalassobacillus devorans]|uniref:TIGR02679 family protein n=1 Tax=Thalassobacillus devorans TaxID=279813 RepID=UPI0004BA77B6|nr:TIGR02679 family protein [Thalassobacillus devorans]
MKRSTQLAEALDYFREERAFDQLFQLFRKKYQSLGRIGGTVRVAPWPLEDLEPLARFFGMTVEGLQEKGSVSLVKFERQLGETRFSDVGLKELLDAYFGETILSKKESKYQEQQELAGRLQQLEEAFPALQFWFRHLAGNTADTYWIVRQVKEQPEPFMESCAWLEAAYRQLPDDYERLPLFSQRVMYNPHALDVSSNLGRLWLHVLSVASGRGGVLPGTSEDINELLQEYRLLRDDLLNFVTCANLLAEKDDAVHPVWHAAASLHMVRNIPIRELLTLERVYPVVGSDVWIVENSSVYSGLMDEVPEAPVICTHGQFKLAGLMLIDRLADEGCTIHYGGDFDPEGLAMAQRLLSRHPEHVQLWKMDPDSYRNTNPTVELEDDRIRKLKAITHQELIETARLLETERKAGYQEALLEEMIKDLK